jgi:hypothetical protein
MTTGLLQTAGGCRGRLRDGKLLQKITITIRNAVFQRCGQLAQLALHDAEMMVSTRSLIVPYFWTGMRVVFISE